LTKTEVNIYNQPTYQPKPHLRRRSPGAIRAIRPIRV